jgi:hypothetical protein
MTKKPIETTHFNYSLGGVARMQKRPVRVTDCSTLRGAQRGAMHCGLKMQLWLLIGAVENSLLFSASFFILQNTSNLLLALPPSAFIYFVE